MRSRIWLAVLPLAALPGCGGVATRAPSSLAAVCAKASRETGAIYRKRVVPVVGRGWVPVVGASRKEAASLKAAAAEVGTVDRAAAVGIRLLAQTPATRSALAHLAENEKQLLEMRAPREELGLDMNFISLGSAAGGCRRLRQPIGG